MIFKVDGEEINIKNIIFDFNGTIANNGKVSNETLKKMSELTKKFNVYILTADTFGTVEKIFDDTSIKVLIIDEKKDKEYFLKEIGFENTISLGNGQNDLRLISKSKIGIGVLGNEGIFSKLILESDIIIKNIFHFFKMIDNPKKLVATLRKK